MRFKVVFKKHFCVYNRMFWFSGRKKRRCRNVWHQWKSNPQLYDMQMEDSSRTVQGNEPTHVDIILNINYPSWDVVWHTLSLSVCLSVCLCLCICLFSLCMTVYLHVCLYVCISLSLSLSLYPPPPLSLSIYLSLFLSLSLSPSMYLSVSLSLSI